MKHLAILTTVLLLFILQACIKTTIDPDKISGEMELTPSFVIAAVKGEVTLSDIVEPTDTLVIDEDNALRLVFTEESIINYQVEDFYTSFPASSYSVLFPLMQIEISDIDDTLDIDPGDDIKLREMSVSTGSVSYTITSWCDFETNIDLVFSSIDDGGSPLATTVNIPANGVSTGAIVLDNTTIHFDSDPNHPCNMLPINYSIIPVGSPGLDPIDSIRVDILFEEPQFDYIKGYFGTHIIESEKDTLDLGLEDLFSKITGSVFLSNPGISVDYTNSFGIPMRVEILVTGKNSEEEISLDRPPEVLLYPTSTDTREVTSSFVINRDNSLLPELVSMLPDKIILGGSASANTDGETAQDNIIFGNSGFSADITIDIPLEFRINDLQLSDTTANFLLDDEEDSGSPLDNLSSLKLNMFIDNGFPLGGSILIALYDSISGVVLDQIDTGDFFEPADVDITGRVTTSTEHTTEIEFTESFLEAAGEANSIIFSFTLFTTDHGSKDVKIYSDYSIRFSAGLSFKANLNLNN